jgi:hypothetical protein
MRLLDSSALANARRGTLGSVSGPVKHPRRASALLLLVAVVLSLSVYLTGTGSGEAPPAVTPPLPTTPAASGSSAWLGLNYNSGSRTGALRDFVERGIVYDREGKLEVRAGRTTGTDPEFRSGLARSYRAGMIPDIQVDPATGPRGCQNDPIPVSFCLPTHEADISSYVHGFVRTAASVLHRYPRHLALFEPTDEPWTWPSPPGSSSGVRAARQYAAILAQLLPAARAAKIPLREIYVPATGVLADGSSWIPDLYRAQPCLSPGPATCGPIEGWNLHPYGIPQSSSEGIDSVPSIRRQMRTGEDNLVVSEIGFCATDVNNGKACDLNRPDIDATSDQTAAWLQTTLSEAARMHRAGWLKALIIWERSGTGFAMQNDNGTLTASGRVLDLFADSPSGR